MRVRNVTMLVLASGLLTLAGCGEPPVTKSPSAPAVKGGDKGKVEHDHSGWWCDEHGVPEEVCSMCSSKVRKAAKAKGDWCAEHGRSKSICFVCDPKLQERFAAKYEAKYGKQPPAPDGQFEKN